MKWYPKKHQVGDKKVTTHFAWVPVRLSCGAKLWLERYKKSYRYKTVERHIMGTMLVVPVNEWVLDNVY